MVVAFVRTLILYLIVIFVLRFMGKRQIGELQPSELVTTIMISNIAAIPIENMTAPLITGIIPIITLACLEVFSSAITLKSRFARRWVIGKSCMVIHDGVVDEKAMHNLRMSIDDMTEQLRGKDIFDISQVAFAFVETNGSLSVYPKFDYRPVTNQDLHVPPSGCDSPPAIIVSDGQIILQALEYCNLSEDWLKNVLDKEKLREKDIFIMSCDRSAKYKIFQKESQK